MHLENSFDFQNEHVVQNHTVQTDALYGLYIYLPESFCQPLLI